MRDFIQFWLLLAVLRLSCNTAPRIQTLTYGRFTSVANPQHVLPQVPPYFIHLCVFHQGLWDVKTSGPPVFKSHTALITLADVSNTTPNIIFKPPEKQPFCQNLEEFYATCRDSNPELPASCLIRPPGNCLMLSCLHCFWCCFLITTGRLKGVYKKLSIFLVA